MDTFLKELLLLDLPKEEYYSQISSLHSLSSLDLSSPITFFMGENGSGKSTLLEAIAVYLGFNAEGGSKNFNFSTKNTHSSLHENIKIIQGSRRPKDSFFLRAESFYNVASYLEEIYEIELKNGYNLEHYGGVPHNRSHGQAFLGVALNKFKANGLYILDEPEAALSPQNQLSFLSHIYDLSKQGAQFIIATHSPIITAIPGAKIYEFGDNIQEINYMDSESFKITKLMLDSPDRVIHNLLS